MIRIQVGPRDPPRDLTVRGLQHRAGPGTRPGWRGVPLSGLATSSASTRSRENTPVLLSYAPTRSLACPAAPRHTKGTPPGGPPAKRQGDCTPARRGQFGARLGTWARLAPCGLGSAGRDWGRCASTARGAGAPGAGRPRRGGLAGTQATQTRGWPGGAGRPSHPGAFRVPGPRSGPAGGGLTACSGGAQPALLACLSSAEPSFSSPTPRLSSWGHALERGDPAGSAHRLRLEAPQGCGTAEPDLSSPPWAHHWACRANRVAPLAGCLAGPAGPSPD